MVLQKLLLGLLLISVSASQACPTVDGAYPVCASDLQIYDNACLAMEANYNNIIVMTCGSMDAVSCQQSCAIQNAMLQCKMICKNNAKASGLYNPDALYCGSDGDLYNDLCTARCRNPSVNQVFDCTVLNLQKNQPYCNSKCQTVVNCRQACASYPTALICARDSIIYRNQCELTCSKASAADGAGSNETLSSLNCQNYVFLHYGIIVGLAPKPIRRIVG